MKRIAQGLGLALLALVAALAAAAWLAIEPLPRVAPGPDVTTADIDHLVAVGRLNDPRGLPAGTLRTMELSERDLDLLTRWAARRWLGGQAEVRLAAGQGTLQASLPLPDGHWLNLRLGLRDAAAPGLPQVDALQVGRLPLPPALALPVLRAAAALRGVPLDAWLRSNPVQAVAFRDHALAMTYRVWMIGAGKGAGGALLLPAEEERLAAYQTRLAQLLQATRERSPRLEAVLRPLLGLALERAAAQPLAAQATTAELRSALLVLAAYVTQQPLELLTKAAARWPVPPWRKILLNGRQDSAQHFMVSNVLATQAGTQLADTVGLWKELSDARPGGSGFSFNDLAADRAGTRFGELALRDPARLRRLFLAEPGASLLPDVSDLPEDLPEPEFVARFGGAEGEATRRLKAEIEARLDATPLYAR